eukprot:scaffold21410_cov39-Phaeocystis_antarctica.AAC.1
MADRAKAQNVAQGTTSFFAGRPERGNHGLCPTSYGAEVDVHRARAAKGAPKADEIPTFFCSRSSALGETFSLLQR